MRRLPSELLARERKRARRVADTTATPERGDLWSVKSTITAASHPGEIVEHSKVPLVVAIVRPVGSIIEVAPVSFEVDLLGSSDVRIDDSELLGQPFLIETWLRMPVTRAALAARVGALSKSDADEFATVARKALTEDAEPLAEDDPRRAFRQDERMRVAFAMAGSGDELVLDEGVHTADAAALALKRKATRWVQTPVRRVNGAIPHPIEGYDRPVAAPSGSPGGSSRHS